MQLSQTHIDRFVADGAATIDGVLDAAALAQANAALDRLYSGPQTDGIIQYPDEPGFYDLYQDPRLEQIAKHVLGSQAVILNSVATLYKRPQPGTEFTYEHEHMDVQFSLADWRARPRRVLCTLLVIIADLPVGRGNTYVRLGSHMQLAEHLDRIGGAPVIDRPMNIGDLPALPWAEPTPIVATAGQVLAFSTNLIHTGTPNLDSEDRRVLFVNFCDRGHMATASPNAAQRDRRTAWRDRLRAAFRPDRRHLLDGRED